MDSSYNTAKTSIVLASGLSLDCRTADSVARTLEPIKAQLAAVDRGQLDWGEAHCHGDWPTALEAGRTVKASAPRSIGFTVLLGITAVEMFRPREALTVLESLDPATMNFKPQQRSIQADFTILAYHMLGDAEGELRTARRALAFLPDNPHMRKDELLALARLGRYKELRERREAWYRRADLLPNKIFNPGMIDLCLAADIRAHGNPGEARMFFQAAADWYDGHREIQEAGAPETTCSRRLLAPLYYINRFDEATALYRRMVAADSTSNIAHEALGALAARRGDRAEADRMDKWLSTHQDHELGRSTYARARIAALLGEKDRAISLLRQAFGEGMGHRMFVHVDPDLESLHNLPAYKQLLAVTG
jgi:tetratricopeptide (TPR) repeat protein